MKLDMSDSNSSNIQRILSILTGFNERNESLSVQCVLNKLQASRSTGYGLIRELVASGWLERMENGQIRLGRKSKSLAFTSTDAPRLEKSARLVSVQPERGRSRKLNLPLSKFELDPTLIRVVDTHRFSKPYPWKLGFSNASTSNAWRRAMLNSMKYAKNIAKNRIKDLKICDANDDSDLQLKQIDELTESGIDLLIISITSVEDLHLSQRLNDLASDGLPIVAVDRRPKDLSSLVSFVTASDHRIGWTSAYWLAEHLQGKGRIWMLSGRQGASPAVRRQKAAFSAFSEFPNLQVETICYTNWTEKGGYESIDNLLNSLEPPSGVWCDSGLQGVGSVRRFLKENLKVPAHTGGDLNEMYKLCLTNKIPMAALDYPASMGARTLQLAMEVLSGSTVPRRLEVPIQIVLPRGCETKSVKADVWAEKHVDWERDSETILSQGPVKKLGEGSSAPEWSAGYG